MTSFKKTAAALALLASAGSAPVFAVTASADIDVTAGIAPVLSMTCTPVKFGVWRVPVRNSGSATAIELSLISDTPTVSGNTAGGVALSTTAGWGAARGQCTVTGSAAADSTLLNITAANSTGTLGADSSSAYTGLSAPATPIAALGYALAAATTAPLTSGGTTFYVGGSLSIPQNVTTANYGAYKATLAPVITADDQQ